MKKSMTGFVPANFKNAGIILLIIGLITLAIKTVSFLTNWFSSPNYFIYLGLGLIFLGLYLIFVVPKE
ncbi:hypothetical protein KJ641_01335 [Patescibacteria group bacterium]|nr:hypothetical protein [Patescibacteria group bacterium]MBU1895494.1 hypothetical protein [Patescibacteria group bacterium]